MAKYKVLDQFYGSKVWIDFRASYIAERLKQDDGYLCDYCGEYIDKADDVTLHHIEELTPDNYKDVMISLNPDNIKQVHGATCHNKIHKHAANRSGKVYIVYGPPLGGKMDYVKRRTWPGDMIVDMDSIYEAISGLPRYDKPNTLLNNVFGVHTLLLDHIKTRYGRWDNAWIIGGYPEQYKRNKIAKDLGAELIFIGTSKADCIERLKRDTKRSKRVTEWTSYIDKWFANYSE